MESLVDQSAFARSPTDWSRDGRFLIFDQTGPKTSNDVWALPLAGGRKPFPVLQAEFTEFVGRLSPDGRWLAYVSTENRQFEVYVASFSGSLSQPAAKWQISTSGGIFPVWNRDGKELFYIASDRRLMAVEIIPGSGFRHGEPKPLFVVHTGGNLSYDVSPDGRHFLIPTQLDPGASAPIVVVNNWTAALKR